MIARFQAISSRIRHHIVTLGPKEPEELLEQIRDRRSPELVQFVLTNLLFSGELNLCGQGRICVLKPDTREYVFEPVSILHFADEFRWPGVVRDSPDSHVPSARGMSPAHGMPYGKGGQITNSSSNR